LTPQVVTKDFTSTRAHRKTLSKITKNPLLGAATSLTYLAKIEENTHKLTIALHLLLASVTVSHASK
jgi:hypothetical protein